MARVLIVGRGAPERGGIPTAMETLLRSDLAARYRLEYLNLGRERGVRGGRPTLSNALRTVEDARRLWWQAKDRDVVHLHSAFAPTVTALRAWALCMVARARGAATVLHIHGGRFPDWSGGRVARLLVRGAGSAVTRFAVVSGRSATALTRLVGTAKVKLVRNGVDTARFHPGVPAGGTPVVLYVGVLSPRKGLLDLFEASRTLHAGGIDHRLWLAGGVPDEGQEASDEVMAAAPPWAEFLGELGAELPRVYRASTVFCLPSWWEAAPLTVMEAAASGLPVVATGVGEVPAMVDDGRTGLLVDPHQPADLAAALGKVLDDPGLRRGMGQRARLSAEERFSLASHVEEVGRLYEEAR